MPPLEGHHHPIPIVRPMLLALLALALVLVVSLYPFDFRSGGDDQWLALADWDTPGLLGAAVLFVPLGFLESGLACAMLARMSASHPAPTERAADIRRRQWANVVMLLVVMDAALLGLVVETLQLWLPGGRSSILDLVANTLGGTVGGILAAQIRSMRGGPARD